MYLSFSLYLYMSADEDGGFATAGNLIAGVERLHPALTLPLLPPSISLPSPLPSLLQSLLPLSSPSQVLPSFRRKGCAGMGVIGGVSYAKVWGSYPNMLQNAGGVGTCGWIFLKFKRHVCPMVTMGLWGSCPDMLENAVEVGFEGGTSRDAASTFFLNPHPASRPTSSSSSIQLILMYVNQNWIS